MRKLIALLIVVAGMSLGASAQCSNTSYTPYNCFNDPYTFSSGVTTRTFTATVTAGQQVVVLAWSNTYTGTLAATAWAACGDLVSLGSSTALGTSAAAYAFYATALSSGTCAVVVTDTTSTLIAARMMIISGAGKIDTSASLASVSVTSGTTANCPAVTTTINSDFVMCMLIDSGNNSGTWTVGTGFSGLVVSGVTVGAEGEVQSTAGAITPQFKYNHTVTAGAVTIALSSQTVPTIASLDFAPVGNLQGNVKTIDGVYINPAPGYVQTIDGIATPFTALPVLTFTDFHGGTNGNVPASADLTAGTYGALFSYVVSGVGAGLTYSNAVSAGNLPQPVVAGSNVYDASGTLGLICNTSTTAVAATYCGSVELQLATVTPASGSVGMWYKPSCPAFGGGASTDCGAFGLLVGGSDYINVHVNGTNGNCPWNGILIEGKGGNSTDCLPFTNNTLYRINAQENEGEAPFTATFTNTSASITATQTLAANQAISFTTTGALPTGYPALEIFKGTYTSGASVTGTVGQTCTLTVTNGGGSGAVGTIMLQATNTISSTGGITWTSRGSSYTSAPTAATVSNGTATCSGTAVISTVLGTPIMFVSPIGLSGSAFGVALTQNGTPIVAGSAGSGTTTVTVYNVVTVCTGNPPVFLGTMFAPSYTTPSAIGGVQMGISGEGPQVNGDTFFFAAYPLNIRGDISLTGCIL